MPETIVLLGDSTLDNEIWVKKNETVAEQLSLRFPKTNQVVNLAVDGFTTTDVLRGAFRDKAVRDQVNHTHVKAYPLKELSKVQNVSHIILSVGGNNIREELGELIGLEPREMKKHLNDLSKQLLEDYIKILNAIKQAQPQANIILMLQYTPDSTNDAYYIYRLLGSVSNLHQLMVQIYRPILQEAKVRNLPIIDMASSLNHQDTSNYVSQIEPSAKGAGVISELIAHVINNHKGALESKIYSRPFTNTNDIIAQEHHDTWAPALLTKKPVAESTGILQYAKSFIF